MTDCVFHAYCDHLRWLGLTPLPSGWLLYKTLKLASHGPKPQPTYGGTVPYIVGKLAARRGLVITVEHHIWTPAHYEASAENWVQRWFIKNSDFGEEVGRGFFFPAIYLPLSSHHAIFYHFSLFSHSERIAEILKQNIVMAIQLRMKGDTQ